MTRPPSCSDITDESHSASSSLSQKVVFTEPDRGQLLTNEGPGGGGGGGGGGGPRGGSEGAWTIYDPSNNLVRQDWTSMINRSLRAASQTNSGGMETTGTDRQGGLNKYQQQMDTLDHFIPPKNCPFFTTSF